MSPAAKEYLSAVLMASLIAVISLALLCMSGCAHPASADRAALEAQDGIRNATTLSQKIEAESRYLQSH
jgi:outer membrane murein-binding lipoprotein Lpp